MSAKLAARDAQLAESVGQLAARDVQVLSAEAAETEKLSRLQAEIEAASRSYGEMVEERRKDKEVKAGPPLKKTIALTLI